MGGRWQGKKLRAAAEQSARLTQELADAHAAVEGLRQIVDAVPVGIVKYGVAGRVDLVNRRVVDWTGLHDPDDFARRSASIVHPDDLDHRNSALELARSGSMARFRIRVRNVDGDWIHVDGSFMPVPSHDVSDLDGSSQTPQVDSIFAIFRDVTNEIEQNEVMLRFRAIAEVTTDIVGIVDLDGRVLYLNPAGRAFLGPRSLDVAHLSEFFEYVPAEYHRLLIGEALSAVMDGDVWQGDLELVRASDLARVPMSAVVVGIRDSAGGITGLAVTYRDVSDRQELEAALVHAATHDPLTGLANRAELFRSLQTSLDSGAPTAVLFFDLDNFKVVNDGLGHHAGDDVLQALAKRIRQGARGADVVGRLGGDEFLIICRGVSLSHEAWAIAEEILTVATMAMDIDGRRHLVTGSIGISLSGSRETTAATLIQEADIAMYRAKRAGGQQAMLFDDSMAR